LTIGELIDFNLAIQQPGSLVGFADLYSEDVESLKTAIQEHYGSQEAWLSLPESTELPDAVSRKAESLVEKFEEWKG
jgi:flagellar hook-associated protein FlgK